MDGLGNTLSADGALALDTMLKNLPNLTVLHLSSTSARASMGDRRLPESFPTCE